MLKELNSLSLQNRLYWMSRFYHFVRHKRRRMFSFGFILNKIRREVPVSIYESCRHKGYMEWRRHTNDYSIHIWGNNHEQMLCILLHEYGHYLDRHNIDFVRVSTKNRKYIIKLERRADKMAIKLARRFGANENQIRRLWAVLHVGYLSYLGLCSYFESLTIDECAVISAKGEKYYERLANLL